MAEKTPKLTPMFEQYLRIKADYPDALLFYRMGDFYELFFDDAVTAARELQIALTSRSRDTENPVPMCGVPWHAAQAYIAQLIDKGFHVAICDQTEDPKAAKGLVQRAVTCVVTPGTVLEDANLDARKALLVEQRDQLVSRMAEMQASLDLLNQKIDRYEQGMMTAEQQLRRLHAEREGA